MTLAATWSSCEHDTSGAKRTTALWDTKLMLSRVSPAPLSSALLYLAPWRTYLVLTTDLDISSPKQRTCQACSVMPDFKDISWENSQTHPRNVRLSTGPHSPSEPCLTLLWGSKELGLAGINRGKWDQNVDIQVVLVAFSRLLHLNSRHYAVCLGAWPATLHFQWQESRPRMEAAAHGCVHEQRSSEPFLRREKRKCSPPVATSRHTTNSHLSDPPQCPFSLLSVLETLCHNALPKASLLLRCTTLCL